MPPTVLEECIFWDAGYRRIGLIGAYIYGGAWLGLCTGMMITTTGAQLIDPAWLGHTLDALHASLATSTPAALPPIARLGAMPMRDAAAVLLVIGALIWLATAGWCVVAWGAFRRSLAATRLQAWLATSLWIAMLAAIVWLPLQLV